MKSIKLVLVSLLAIGANLEAGSGWKSFGGALGGSFIGSSLANASAPREKTVVVKEVRSSHSEERLLEQDYRRLQKEYNALERDYKALEVRYTKLEEQVSDLKSQVADLKAENKELKAEVKQLEKGVSKKIKQD
ncbi:MAG: hypothetical protein EBU90_05195 [Proteobacteria bacterium]|nr:hypothetical protein [Pseudomonadota bacterium]NBP14970.1 hypothetical protein [bacterium]